MLKLIFFFAGSLAFYLLKIKGYSFIKPNKSKETKENYPFLRGLNLRGCDTKGCGSYGASRGSRTHKGIDIVSYPLDNVKAPFDCQLIRYGKVYANDNRYNLIEIKGTGLQADLVSKLMYVNSDYPLNSFFQQGEIIGYTQDITKKYNGITNHYHLELRKNGKIINPEKYL